jgi:hypothetical protein
MKKPEIHFSRGRCGFGLVELAIASGLLVSLALIALKATLQVSEVQKWTVIQSLSDSYLSRETALASRQPFSDIISESSPWPDFPSSGSQEIEIGRLPGGVAVNAVLLRTKQADANNLVPAGGVGTLSSNPSGTEGWKLRSILVYQIGERSYYKARTTFRTR